MNINDNNFFFSWSEDVEAALSSSNINENLKAVLGRTEDMLKLLADLVLQDQPPLRRKKLEHLVTNLRKIIFFKLIKVCGSSYAVK